LNPSLRILLLTPTAFPSTTGNASTTERWRRSLVKQGHDVQVLATENLDVFALRQMLAHFKPDLIHLHHAFRAGELLVRLNTEQANNGWALVVSPGGTDIHLDTKVEDRRRIITRVFERVKAVIAQSEEMMQRIVEAYPQLQGRITLIPKSFCWMGQEEFNLRGASNCGPDDILFFFPAGIRPVKGNLEALLLLEKVYSLRPSIRAVFAGPALDKDYAAKFEQEVERLRTFARWLPPIPFQAMRSAYQGADVILNFSFSEGISNVLLEAKALGKPILASDIPGNRWPVLGDQKDLPAGLLFDLHSPEHFIQQALRLVDDKELREKLGQGGKNQAARLPGSEEEARGLIRVYEEVLNRPLREKRGSLSGQGKPATLGGVNGKDQIRY
jgi:glycosyltransferase involved in cell wall biosynthesis